MLEGVRTRTIRSRIPADPTSRVSSRAKERIGPRGRRAWAASVTCAVVLSVGAACGGNNHEADRTPPVPIGMGCSDFDDMVVVPGVRGARSFCIDRYEASIAKGDLGNAAQSGDGDG